MKSFNVSEQSLESVFGNEFIIPDFQRPYSWSRTQCAELFSDLISAFDDYLAKPSEEQKYFLGNIVYYPEPKSGENVWNIVDGQQRLTTLMLLIRALCEKTRGESGETGHTPLKRKIYRLDLEGDPIDGNVRLKSKVLPGEKEYDLGDLEKTLALDHSDFSKMLKKNPFRINYECLVDGLDEWWKDNNDKWGKFIKFLNQSVMLLLIKCESKKDALELFQIINDRGMRLDDTDVFKAEFYKAVKQKERAQFINKWNKMSGHLDLFQTYMHISKAKKAPPGNYGVKRIKLRKYMEDEYFNDKKNPLKERWKTLMNSLELCHLYKTNVGKWCDDEGFSAKESVYWEILSKYPNKSWQDPLFVFMHKYADIQEGKIVFPESKKTEYLNLFESTVKFFFIRGVVKNSIEFVRNIAYKVSVQIEQNEQSKTYLATYKEESKGDLEDLEEKLKDFNYGKSYTKGLVFLNSFLNSCQRKNPAIYAEIIRGDAQIEHILPQTWLAAHSHYAGWDEESYKKWVDELGNLVPLEQRINIKCSNWPFNAKQDEYKASKVQDALALSKKKPARWHPKDLEKRHQEVVERLMKFFRS